MVKQLCRQEELLYVRKLNGCQPCLGKWYNQYPKIAVSLPVSNEVLKYKCCLLFSFQLTFECGVGIAVLVRCFVNKHATEDQIADRLGDGFSRAPFATVVVCLFL